MTSASSQEDGSAPAYADKRHVDRRSHSRHAFHWPERRAGFDRRSPDRRLMALRDNHALLVGVILLIGALSCFDLAMTARVLALGAREGNPIMRAALGNSIWTAAAVKAASFLLVSLAIWCFRRYRLVLQFAVGAAILYVALTLYHLIEFAALT